MIRQAHWTGELTGPKKSKPPRYAGLDAGARGMADHATREADALLLWYRTCGQDNRTEVELYLARRAIAADWHCTTPQAAEIIRDAMAHVITRRPNAGASAVTLRKADYLEMRGQASAWLRAGLLEAVYRYEMANLDAEPLPPASRQSNTQDSIGRPQRRDPRALPRDIGQQQFQRAA